MEDLNRTQARIDGTETASSSSSTEAVTFSLDQALVVITKLASQMGLSNPTALPNGEASSPNSHSEPAFSPPPPRWIQAYSQFSRSVATYLWHGPASDSWTTNRVGLESFIDFVWLHPAYRNEDNSVLPATERAIMEWIASLGARNVRSKTLKYYLNDIRAFHDDAGYPATVCESPVVQRLIRGIKRFHEERFSNPKLPITIDILRRLCAGASPNRLQDVVFKAAITLAFAAFLRLSEFAVPANTPFDPSTYLSRGCVEFLPNASSPTHVALSLPASKTDPFRKRATIHVAAAPGALTCPVAALKALFEHDPRPPSTPLFSDCAPGQPLTRESFTLFCYINLSFRGVDITGHSGISFRRGAALAADTAGYSEDEIRLLGRWRSDADKLYREVSQDRILHLSARLHSTEFPPQASDPPAA